MGDYLLGDIMTIKYVRNDILLSVDISDVKGGFISTLNDLESELLKEWAKSWLDCVIAQILHIRQGKESQDGLEG